MNKSSAAKIVREIMKSHGKSMVFNNIYDTGTRTVKCYAHRENSNRLVDDIARTLYGLGVPYKIKFNVPKRTYSGGPALIVKL